VIPKLVRFKSLTSSNWINWKGHTTRALEILQVWNHVKSDLSAVRPDPLLDPRVTPAYLTAWDYAEQVALTQILHNIDDTKLTITRKCTTARAAWVALETNFVQASVTSRMSILNQINQFTWDPETTVLDHTNRLRALCDNLEESGGSIPLDQLILHLLNSMPEEYEQTVVFLRMQPPASLTLDYVCNALTAAETTFKSKERTRERAAALVTRVDRRRGESNQFQSSYGGPNRDVVCSLCKKSGHPRSRCFQDPKVGYPDWWGDRPKPGEKNQRHRGKSSRDDNESDNSDDDDSDDDHSANKKKKTKKSHHAISFHITTEWPDLNPKEVSPGTLGMVNSRPSAPELAVLRLSGCSSWVLDSGCSTHFCCDRSVLVDLTEITPVTIHIGCAVTKAYAKGTAVLWLSEDGVNHNHEVTLRDVLYVPDFSVNLMSVRLLAQAGFGLIMMGITAHLTLADTTPWAVAHVDERDDLYVLEARANRGRSVTAYYMAADDYHPVQLTAGGDGTVTTTVDPEDVIMQSLGNTSHAAGIRHSVKGTGDEDGAVRTLSTVDSEHASMFTLSSDPRDADADDSAVNAVADEVKSVPVCAVPSYFDVDNALVSTYIGEGENCERLRASTDEVAPSPVPLGLR
jgi:hypothetical protein